MFDLRPQIQLRLQGRRSGFDLLLQLDDFEVVVEQLLLPRSHGLLAFVILQIDAVLHRSVPGRLVGLLYVSILLF